MEGLFIVKNLRRTYSRPICNIGLLGLYSNIFILDTNILKIDYIIY